MPFPLPRGVRTKSAVAEQYIPYKDAHNRAEIIEIAAEEKEHLSGRSYFGTSFEREPTIDSCPEVQTGTGVLSSRKPVAENQ